MFTYDPGFTSTGACESKITYIDGDEGILLYRGLPIEQLAEHGDFLETCYLLLYGELPTPAQKADFDYRVTRHTMVHEQMSRFFQGFRRDAHPMAVMTGSVGALSAFYHDSTDISDPHQRMVASIRMIAKMPTLAAMAYKYIGRPAVRLSEERPRLRHQLPAHVLCGAGRGLQAEPGAGARDGPHLHPARRPRAERLDLDGAARRLDRRQSVRLHRGRHRRALGPGAWRRQRGGAEDARRDRHRRPHPGIHQARQGPEGHLPPDGLRPPRLQELRSAREDHAEDRARGAERDSATATIRCCRSRWSSSASRCSDEYFIEKKLYPNVDFYSGITLKAMGFPTTMFTVLFAVARAVGWIAQWKEMIEDPTQRIGRPRQLYTGATRRDYIPISRRK